MLSRRLLYAAMGAVLSLGAPLGLAVVRALEARTFSLAWLGGELAGDLAAYLYITVSTLLAFSLFGFAIGGQADRFIDLSMTDPLTRLWNRRALDDRIEEELARSARYGTPLSLLMMDVDHLKAINDREGHRAGDAALQRVGAAVQSGSRSADLGARWGGDEFALLAPNTDAAAAEHLAERVRALVAAGTRPNVAQATTISVGFATVEPGSPRPALERLVRTADEALYEAKRHGGNCVAGHRMDGATPGANPARPSSR